MEKIIKIGEKEFKIKSSAYTMFAYQDEFKSDMLDDVTNLQKTAMECKSVDKNSDEYTEKLISLIKPVMKSSLQILYIMAKEADDNIVNYKEFLKNIDNLFSDFSWFNDTLTCALAPFTRRVQKTE